MIERFLSGILLISALLSGCSKAPEQAPAADTKSQGKSSTPPPKPPQESVVSTQAVHRSVFNIPKNARDPFFPQSARTREKAPEGQPAAPVNIPALLQKEFVGVMGHPERRVALIRNTILRAGKSAVIALEANGKPLEVTVKCLDMTRTSVTLKVEGMAEPLKLITKTSAE